VNVKIFSREWSAGAHGGLSPRPEAMDEETTLLRIARSVPAVPDGGRVGWGEEPEVERVGVGQGPGPPEWSSVPSGAPGAGVFSPGRRDSR